MWAPGLRDAVILRMVGIYTVTHACLWRQVVFCNTATRPSQLNRSGSRWGPSLSSPLSRRTLQTRKEPQEPTRRLRTFGRSSETTRREYEDLPLFWSSSYRHGDRKLQGKIHCVLEMLQISIHSSRGSLALHANLVILVQLYTTCSVRNTRLSLG